MINQHPIFSQWQLWSFKFAFNGSDAGGYNSSVHFNWCSPQCGFLFLFFLRILIAVFLFLLCGLRCRMMWVSTVGVLQESRHFAEYMHPEVTLATGQTCECICKVGDVCFLCRICSLYLQMTGFHANAPLQNARSGAHATAKTMIEDILTIRADACSLVAGFVASPALDLDDLGTPFLRRTVVSYC